METQLTTRTNQTSAAIMERVLIVGDLAQLTAQERVSYYRSVCESIGLNPLTKPFDYINLNGKLTLYAKKDAADQLRKTNGVSIGKPDIQFVDDLILVTVAATDKTGRTDSDVGIVKKTDMRGDVANAVMKAVTKAKRRVTLSLCGLGWLDETEVESIPDAKPVVVVPETGEIVTPAKATTQPTTDPVVQAATNLGGVVRPVQQTQPAQATAKQDPAAKRTALVATLNQIRGQLATAGVLDVMADTEAQGTDNFAALEDKIKRAQAALDKAQLQPT